LLALRLPEPGLTGPGRVHVLPAGRFQLICRRGTDGWGEGLVLRTDHLLTGHDCLMVYGPVVGAATRPIVLPPIDPLPARPVPPGWSARTARGRPATPPTCATSGRSRRATGCGGWTGACHCGPASRTAAHCTSASTTPTPTPTWCSRWTPAPTSVPRSATGRT